MLEAISCEETDHLLGQRTKEKSRIIGSWWEPSPGGKSYGGTSNCNVFLCQTRTRYKEEVVYAYFSPSHQQVTMVESLEASLLSHTFF